MYTYPPHIADETDTPHLVLQGLSNTTCSNSAWILEWRTKRSKHLHVQLINLSLCIRHECEVRGTTFVSDDKLTSVFSFCWLENSAVIPVSLGGEKKLANWSLANDGNCSSWADPCPRMSTDGTFDISASPFNNTAFVKNMLTGYPTYSRDTKYIQTYTTLFLLKCSKMIRTLFLSISC